MENAVQSETRAWKNAVQSETSMKNRCPIRAGHVVETAFEGENQCQSTIGESKIVFRCWIKKKIFEKVVQYFNML